MKNIRHTLLAAAIAAMLPILATAADYNIKNYGAVAKKSHLSTAAIQKAIDECAAKGGGRVVVPKGKWLTGALVLKSGVTLYLERKATLYGSTDPRDYVLNKSAKIIMTSQLIYAIQANNIGIAGEGTIDGQGAAFTDAACNAVKITRPMLIRFDTCKGITVSGVTMRNAGVWVQHYYDCENLTIKGITVFSHCNVCNDGIDITNCRNVLITQSKIDSDDDAICLKTFSEKPCENVTVTDCVVATHCNALKIGSETVGDFRNIKFSNCKVVRSKSKKVINGCAIAVAGIAVESIDGARISNVSFSDISINGTESPIFIRLGNRNDTYGHKPTKPQRGDINGVTIKNVTVKNAGTTGSSITGIPGQTVKNITLSNVIITHKGGQKERAIPKDNREKSEPNAMMWGTLPAQGIFVKYAENITTDEVNIRAKKADKRPAIYRVNVK